MVNDISTRIWRNRRCYCNIFWEDQIDLDVTNYDCDDEKIDETSASVFLNPVIEAIPHLDFFAISLSDVVDKITLNCKVKITHLKRNLFIYFILFSFLQNLGRLSLVGVFKDDSTSHIMEKVLRGIPEIIDLDLSGTICSDEMLTVIGKHCHKLRYLNLTGCKRVTIYGLMSLSEGNESEITHLDLTNVIILPEACLVVLDRFPLLSQLRYNWWNTILEAAQNKPDLVFPDIEEISMTEVKADPLQQMQKTLPNLCEICLSYLYLREKDWLIDMVGFYNTKLTSLNLDSISAYDVDVIGYFCPFLENLEVTIDTPIPVSGNVMEKPQNHVPFKFLRTLVLRLYVNFEFKYLRSLFENCSNLKKFDLSTGIWSTTINDKVVSDWLNPLSKLKEVRIRSCPLVTGDAIMELLTLENPLKFLQLNSSTGITEEKKNEMKKYVNDCNLDVLFY